MLSLRFSGGLRTPSAHPPRTKTEDMTNQEAPPKPETAENQPGKGLDVATCSPSCGITAMREWNSTWRHNHAPMWFKKLIRKWAIRNGKWGGCHMNCLPAFFDHWGSFKVGKETLVATQPYWYACHEVLQFANEMGCRVTQAEGHGPWHPKTGLFIFQENAECTPTANE